MAKQRLVLCLDGTWNNQDDSTNVLHHFNLVKEGPAQDGLIQKKEYQRGVGTGVLDHISGGGFGFGLEEKVREAYNWLVENYQEDDEIYIFGFSRGAFTARSLVGFIGTCGLLRRAAPLTVGQLWQGYAILGREREEREPVSNRPKDLFRKITDLVKDPWLAKNAPIGPDGVRGQRNLPKNESEHLLVRWSRRVKITFLGVYDTVGAIGWDALAFPVLKSRLAMHHNLRPTTLIQSCRHALAIQEHRTSFNHTPFMAFVGHSGSEQEIKRATGEADAGDHWQAVIEMWNRKIEQRWFVGAHSNIGGGYENNRLAARPFEWMLEGAQAAGLECESIPSRPFEQSLPPPRDSYAEFAAPLWAMILRAKRNYRLIDPEPEPQASLSSSDGFSLHTIHETVDDSVPQYFADTRLPLPPNLSAYAKRKERQFPGAVEPIHTWFGDGWMESAALVLWASLAAVGFIAICKLIGLTVTPVLIGIACGIAFAAPVLDWGESLANFRLALGRTSPWRKAFVDTIYWTRCFGVVFFFVGAIHFVYYFWNLGWASGMAGALSSERTELHWLMPVFAVAGMALANVLDGVSGGAAKDRWNATLPALAAALAAAPLAAIVLILLSSGLHALFPELVIPVLSSRPVDDGASMRAALLLLLELGFFYFVRAFLWVGEPMGKANLGSITKLQNCATSGCVSKCLETWRQKLASRWRSEDERNGPAARRVRSLVREALWRDMLGFIPVYTLVLGFGLWFAAEQVKWPFLSSNPLLNMQRPFLHLEWPIRDLAFHWPALNGSFPFVHFERTPFVMSFWLLPLVALVADYAEDFFHLSYLRRIERGKKPAFAWLSFTMTWFKNVAFAAQTLITLAAIVRGTRLVIEGGSAPGWNGTAALLVFGVGCAAIILAVVKKAQRRWAGTQSR